MEGFNLKDILSLLPSSTEMIKTKALNNWGIPRNSNLRQETLQDVLNDIHSLPTALDPNSVGVAGEVVPFKPKVFGNLTEFGKVVGDYEHLLNKYFKGNIPDEVINNMHSRAKQLANTDPESLFGKHYGVELINKAKEYTKILDKHRTLEKLNLPHESLTRFNIGPSNLIQEGKIIPFEGSKLPMAFKDELLSHFGPEIVNKWSETEDFPNLALRLSKTAPENLYLYPNTLIKSAKEYIKNFRYKLPPE